MGLFNLLLTVLGKLRTLKRCNVNCNVNLFILNFKHSYHKLCLILSKTAKIEATHRKKVRSNKTLALTKSMINSLEEVLILK